MRVAPLDSPGVRSAIPASPSGRDLQAPLPPGPSNISPARWGKLLVRVGPNYTIKRGHAGLAKSISFHFLQREQGLELCNVERKFFRMVIRDCPDGQFDIL